jgi:hypothetical protein
MTDALSTGWADVEASILADAAGARRRHLAQRAQRILQEFHGVTA